MKTIVKSSDLFPARASSPPRRNGCRETEERRLRWKDSGDARGRGKACFTLQSTPFNQEG